MKPNCPIIATQDGLPFWQPNSYITCMTWQINFRTYCQSLITNHNYLMSIAHPIVTSQYQLSDYFAIFGYLMLCKGHRC